VKLIPNWRKAWRMVSMVAMAVTNSGLLAWAAMPTELRDHIPVTWVVAFACAMLCVGMVGRLFQQEGVSE
jgi:amino acid transporter